MPGANELVVISTGPLVSLGRAGLLEVVGRLTLTFITPSAVADEINVGSAAGHPVEVPGWVGVVDVPEPVTALAAQALDRGEAAVIQLALDRGIRTVCIDEWRGRRAARASGLIVTGSLGLLGRAKHEGLVSSVRPFVKLLADRGAFYHPDLVRRFLEAMGEA